VLSTTMDSFPSGMKKAFTVKHWAIAMVQLTVFDKCLDGSTAMTLILIAQQGLSSVNKLFDVTSTQSGALDFASLLIEVHKGQWTTSDISAEVSRPDSLQLEHSQTGNSCASALRGPDSWTMSPNNSYQAKGSRPERLERQERLLERPERLQTLEVPKARLERSWTEVPKVRLEQSQADNSRGERSLAEF
jgi:hypothetical protein